MFHLIDKARNPRINADSGVTLASRLILAADPTDAQIEEAVRNMTVARDDVTDVQQERDRFQPERIRTATAPLAIAFTSMHDALKAIAVLPTGGPRAKRAAAVLTRVLPNGATFTSGEGSTIHNAAKRAIERTEEDGVGEEIDALIGAEFRDAATRTTLQLGEVLGVGSEPLRVPSSTALQEKLGRLSRAIGRYLRIEAGRVDEEDPASIARFIDVIAPVEAHRDATKRRTPTDEPESDGDPTPAPGGGTPGPLDPEAPGGPFEPMV